MVDFKLLIGVVVASICAAQIHGQQLCGHVSSASGAPVPDARVIASGFGFQGWTKTNADGSFCVPHNPGRRTFISVRHLGFAPVLIPSSALTENPKIVMSQAGPTVGRLEDCPASSLNEKGWAGTGLRVKAPRNKYIGPVHGQHDTHWYIPFGKQRLHVVDGYAWHGGLPSERLLISSKQIQVRGWEAGNIVGLDLAGVTEDGQRWRWIGAPLAFAVSYENASTKAAEFFDRVLHSLCRGEL
ncbi:MAG: carboxypeptidase-like regulatory domain-containing protein [Bryobacteraceae bacterium]